MKLRSLFRSQLPVPAGRSRAGASASRLWLCALWAAGAALALGLPAQAANPITWNIASPLTRTLKPFSPQVRAGRWLPLAITLDNDGDGVQGTLTLRLSSSSAPERARLQYFSAVDLPRGAHKTYWLYGHIEQPDLNIAEVELQGPSVQTLKTSFPLTSSDPGTRLVCTISDAGEQLSSAAIFRSPQAINAEELQDNGPALLSSDQSPVRPFTATRDLVPDRWIGLDAADVVVVHELAGAFDKAQIEALRGYVASGGTLVLIGGANRQALAASPFIDLSPVAPEASGDAAASEKQALAQRYVRPRPVNAADRLGSGSFPITRGSLRANAQLLAGTAQAPLIAAANRGAGRVVFMAFDVTKPPFLDWKGNSNLWAEVFTRGTRPRRLAHVNVSNSFGAYYNGSYRNPSESGDYGNNSLLNALATAPQLRTPPVSAIAWFLALYVFCLVPLNYCVLRFFDRRELAWVTVPLIVVAFSVVSYAAALRIKGSEVLTRHINIVQGSTDSPMARADALLWLFSPRKTTYHLASSDPNMVLGNFEVANNDTGRDAVREPKDASFALDASPINMWSFRTFAGESIVQVGGGVQLQQTGAAPAVRNNMSLDLRGVVLVNNGEVSRYGDIAAGGVAPNPTFIDGVHTVDADLQGRILRASQVEQIFTSNPDDVSNTPGSNLATAALAAALGPNFGKTNPGTLLIGWGSKPVTSISVEGEAPRAQSISLFVFRVPANQVPSRFQGAREALVQPAGMQPVDARLGSTSGSFLFYNAELPQKAAGAAPSPLTITASGGGWRNSTPNRATPLFPARLQVWNLARGTWQDVANRSSTSTSNYWKFTGVVPDARDVVRAPDNTVQLRVSTAHSQVTLSSLHVLTAPR